MLARREGIRLQVFLGALKIEIQRIKDLLFFFGQESSVFFLVFEESDGWIPYRAADRRNLPHERRRPLLLFCLVLRLFIVNN